MARKPTVDVDKVMQMLLEGASTQSVAEHFGVSRQAIDLHRRKFIQNGQLVEKRAPRRNITFSEVESGKQGVQSVLHHVSNGKTGTETPQASHLETIEKPVKTTVKVSLDRRIDLIIEAFDSLKQFPQPELEAELEKYKQEYRKAAERIDILEKVVSRQNQ